MILTKIINRTSITVDEGTMGFHDYTTRFQNFEEFVKNVEMEASIIEWAEGFELINVSFVNDTKAVIIYRQLEEEK